MATFDCNAIHRQLIAPFSDVLSNGALDFVWALHDSFGARRNALLAERETLSQSTSRESFDFLADTAGIRNDNSWRVPPPPPDLVDRRVEIASPAENRKVVINALNAGAQVWIADLEDAMSPTWHNAMISQRNLREAVEGTIEYHDVSGRDYRIGAAKTAIVVRPRGWHLPECHLRIANAPACASLVDFGLYFYHCAQTLIARGSGPYFYLPKIERAAEARLWHDVFEFAEKALPVPRGSIRATAIIEHIGAAWQMDEILHALGPYASGLSAGRWDYLFSIAKVFKEREACVFPDRSQLSASQRFLRAYAERLVQTCHRRKAHALGGVSTQIPDRHDPVARARAIDAVRRDKESEADEGFDGTWVVHPDLVPVCHVAFGRVLEGRPNQIDRPLGEATMPAQTLVAVERLGTGVTEAGLRANIAVAIRYLDAWLRGRGSVRLFGLMEGAATVEIARMQVWQWLHHGTPLVDGRTITHALVAALLDDEIAQYRAQSCASSNTATGTPLDPRNLARARVLFEDVTMRASCPAFMTLRGYAMLTEPTNPAPSGTSAASGAQHLMQPVTQHTAPRRLTTLRLTSSSGMFTHLQLKPRAAFSFAFMGWSAWLIEHAVAHAAMIRDHATGFVPIALDIDYLEPATFFDCEQLDVVTEVRTWNPRRFHTLQDVDVEIASSRGQRIARIRLQEVCVRIESPDTLAAEPGRIPESLASLLDTHDDIDERPVLRNRDLSQSDNDHAEEALAQARHPFTVHRHACELADQWYSEHVCDFVGDSREALVFARLAEHPALLAGLAQRVERIHIGLRRPYMLFDRGEVLTRARRQGDALQFVHRLLTASGENAGDAIETFYPEGGRASASPPGWRPQ
ncbi:malate synthase A [Paraburkholderia sp. J94]|uniref:malate synthase A n=1 Tax=Paraburkholderia sp. J94 TaxID=2805441 RepID=UPI002AB323CA|nr:malate synthase A [Paraburkholderia sp. J94]